MTSSNKKSVNGLPELDLPEIQLDDNNVDSSIENVLPRTPDEPDTIQLPKGNSNLAADSDKKELPASHMQGMPDLDLADVADEQNITPQVMKRFEAHDAFKGDELGGYQALNAVAEPEPKKAKEQKKRPKTRRLHTRTPFPKEEWRALSKALRSWYRSLADWQRLLIPGIPALMLLLWIILVLAGALAPSFHFIERHEESLLGGAGKHYLVNGHLFRGEAVEVLGRKNGFVLISDQRGRIGYIRDGALSRAEVLNMPEVPFDGCKIAKRDDDRDLCLERVSRQLSSCLSYCTMRKDEPDCPSRCQAQAELCSDGCTSIIKDPTPSKVLDDLLTPSRKKPKTKNPRRKKRKKRRRRAKE